MTQHDEPAFPTTGSEMIASGDERNEPQFAEVQYRGMSLRDYFAAQALIGLMSDPGLRPDNEGEFAHMAKRLYQVADAMMAERASPR